MKCGQKKRESSLYIVIDNYLSKKIVIKFFTS